MRFEDGDSARLVRTFSNSSSTWTWSAWVKRGNLGSDMLLFGYFNASPENFEMIRFDSSDRFWWFQRTGGTGKGQRKTSAVFRDVSAWYHFVVKRTGTSLNMYVNGEELTTFDTSETIATDSYINEAFAHQIGERNDGNNEFDGYLANVTFIDGTALDPTSFGEYDGTLWKPKSDTAIQALTFGTNGFYLPMKQTTEAEGFSTVTYTGSGSAQSIEGVGFEPDLVWTKARDSTTDHKIYDSVRGVTKALESNTTDAETAFSQQLKSFDTNGFSLGSNAVVNGAGRNYVAWCWDAGSGSAVSNTDGATTSNVKANTDKGFSICSWTVGSENSTVGHGLNSAPEVILMKSRSYALGWAVQHTGLTNMTDRVLSLNTDSAEITAGTSWSAPTSTTFGTSSALVISGETWVGYCFHSVSGYSSIGSYTGNGSTTGPTVTTNFPVAFVMIKRTDVADNWIIYDNTRSPVNPADKGLFPNDSSQELTGNDIDFNASDFQLKTSDNGFNASGGTYIYMAFADTRDATFFGDTSGNGNNWTPNALNNTDVVLDSPVAGGNFCTWNSLSNGTGTLSEGNLKLSGTATATARTNSTISVSSGKWYFETHLTASQTYTTVGIGQTSATNQNVGQTSTSYGFIFEQAQKINSNTTASYGNTLATGDVFMCAFDLDNNELFFGKNGTWFNSSDPATNTSPAYSISNGSYHVMARPYNASSVITANFGQDSSFAGNETPQGNTDDNGVGDFQYAPPSGFLALATSNLPLPAITAPDEYFNTLLYTGTGSSLSVTGANFQPDWTWIKKRSGAENHALYDAVRGATNRLQSNVTAGEGSGGLTSFDSDGFTVSGLNGTDGENGFTYVAWNWLAGNGTVSNTSGSITSTVSANQTAGFSISTYTGNGTSGATFGHGLSQKPDMVILKRRSSSEAWPVWVGGGGFGATEYMRLNTTIPKDTATSLFNSTLPTSSVITLGNGGFSNANNETYVCYAFNSVESYSKIGSYTGNGSTDGTFVNLGFRPSWIMVKRTDSTSNWLILDNKREGYNPDQDGLDANGSGTEGTAEQSDFLSNGFKVRNNSSGSNASGGTFIFLAFAEAPFRNANAR